MTSSHVGSLSNVKLTVLVDNRLIDPRLESTWGLSILVEANNTTILFDVDTRWNIVYNNAQLLQAPLSKVDYIVISHWHGDHAGGLDDALEYYSSIGKRIGVIVPSRRIFHLIRGEFTVGAIPVKISEGIITSGVLGRFIKEQSLILNVEGKGPIILVGCSHPGLDKIVRRACRILGVESVYGVIGGYHVGLYGARRVERVFREYNVRIVGPAHCTGDDAIRFFKKRFGEGFVEVYTGRIIEFRR